MTVHPFPSDAANRRFLAMKYWLLGAKYHEALRSLNFNQRFFTGVRKDGITPEFDHHICQAQFMRTLIPHLIYPEQTIATIFTHDTQEDKDVSWQEIKDIFEDHQFGLLVADATWKVTKVFRGEKRNEAQLFQDMASCPIASLVKGVDRIHNFQTMVGVFSKEKQEKYIKEGIDLFLPMLKEAERNFPQQEPAYKNIRTFLKSQMQLLQVINSH